MCGIAGYLGKKTVSVNTIEKTLELMAKRGPDNQDHIHYNLPDNQNLYLLHSRLSIIDLNESASQPFTIGPYTVVFNGEIYNYIELREQLINDGVVFKTQSDTEVLLQMYIKYKKKCVQYFEGMWSFAIYDDTNKELFISRDRFAEKPLYIFENSEGFYFASEIKFLQVLRGCAFEKNTTHLKRYLVNGYKSLYKTNDTFYEGVNSLPFASNLTVSFKQKSKIEQYWKPSVNIQKMSLEDAIEGFRERLFRSMELRLRSDVPVAFCLSGGVDSAALASISAKVFNKDVSTYSIISDDQRYDESKNINATINDLGCENTKIKINRSNFIENLSSLVDYHDSPVATISYYIHSMLSKAIAADGYKVVYSGTAADELVTGYYDHFILHLYEMHGHPDYAKALLGWEDKIKRYIRNPLLSDAELYLKDKNFREHVYFKNDEFADLLNEPFSEGFSEENYCDSLLKNRMLNELFHEATPLILHEDDKNSMFYSLENRSPYLDKNLMEFSYSIPSEHLIQEGVSKYVLRESLAGVLNDEVRLDTRKMGFNAPIMDLFDLKNKENLDFLLNDSPLYDIINREKIEQLVTGVDEIPNSLSKYLFSLINVKLFMETS